MKKYTLIFILIFLSSCQNNLLSSIAKTDIDIVTEIHINNAKSYIEDLIIKLYKINPVYLNKNKEFDSVSQVVIDIFKEVEIKDVDKSGQENIDLIMKGFNKDFNGDRIYYVCKGLYGMINASYNYKDKFWIHTWANILFMHRHMAGDEDFSYKNYVDGNQWFDYTAGAVLGWKVRRRWGIFAEGEINGGILKSRVSNFS